MNWSVCMKANIDFKAKPDTEIKRLSNIKALFPGEDDINDLGDDEVPEDEIRFALEGSEAADPDAISGNGANSAFE